MVKKIAWKPSDCQRVLRSMLAIDGVRLNRTLFIKFQCTWQPNRRNLLHLSKNRISHEALHKRDYISRS